MSEAGPSALKICEGCQAGFSYFGYHSHLRQTTDPLCSAIYRAQSQYVHADSEGEEDEMDVNEADSISTQQAIPFGGDLFGSAESYMDEDFGQNDQSGLPTSVQDQSVVDSDDNELEQNQGPGWEPARVGANEQPDDFGLNDDEDNQANEEGTHGNSTTPVPTARVVTPRIVRYSDRYPNQEAGAIRKQKTPLDHGYREEIAEKDNPYAPFVSRTDWELGKWGKMRSAGSTAFDELLAIAGLHEKLDLSYKNSRELNKIIDEKLPGRPKFDRREVVVAGEVFELYSRDIIECIRALWGDPEFAPYLVFEPERHYADQDETHRVYHDMHTGKWWWATQKEVERVSQKTGRTIIPVIISSDKTQLTVFRNKTAYPVYLTIGNIPKHIRRKPSQQAQVLLAYLPTAKLDHISNKAARRRTQANLFHACMSFIVKPLEKYGTTGLHMTSGDGAVRSCHPIFSNYVGDYPEQVLVTAVKTGECPECPAPHNELGNPASVGGPRDLAKILEALDSISQGPTVFANACREAGIKPIQDPFWKNLPFVNIYRSITPDILHQLYQGVLKHLIGWLRTICGDAEIDARCRRLPPNHNIHLFLKGICHLSRVTGTEHDQICRFLLGLIIDIRLPNNHSSITLVKAVRGLLDFLNLARYPVHTAHTLDHLDAALKAFHDNKQIFVDLGVRANFNIPKLHYASHYRFLIELYGTTDNYNTEYTERLHIDLAKNAYRSTNSKDEYPQMTQWLDRRERIIRHDRFLARQFDILPPEPPPPLLIQTLTAPRRLKMAKEPNVRSVPISSLITDYGATHFEASISRWVVQYQNPTFSKREIEDAAQDLDLPFNKVSVYHRIKFISTDPFALDPTTENTVDSVIVNPSKSDKYGNVVPGRFDTVLVKVQSTGGESGIIGHRIGRVRCVFILPEAVLKIWFPGRRPSSYLAYIEWFSPFTPLPDTNLRLYKVSRPRVDQRVASVVPIELIRNSVHLFPKFGRVAPSSWTSATVLDLCNTFYVNTFSDRFVYSTLF